MVGDCRRQSPSGMLEQGGEQLHCMTGSDHTGARSSDGALLVQCSVGGGVARRKDVIAEVAAQLVAKQ